MLKLAYSVSFNLKESVRRVELLRRQLLSVPLPPAIERQLRWEALVDRLYWLHQLIGQPTHHLALAKELKRQSPSGLAGRYQRYFSLLAYEWLGTNKPVTPAVVEMIWTHFTGQKKLPLLPATQRDLVALLNYLEGTDRPVIQAGLAVSQLNLFWPDGTDGPILIAALAYLLLYRAGYDCRGLLVLEKYWKENERAFHELIAPIGQGKTSNVFLEFFTQGVIESLEQAQAQVNRGANKMLLPTSAFILIPRQRDILAFLDVPDSIITNRNIQKHFKVSQITASRDLAKLVGLGLIFARGKGRSVSYSRL